MSPIFSSRDFQDVHTRDLGPKDGKLRLVEAPHRKAMLEQDMRYDLTLDGEIVGEAWFNMTGYVCGPKEGKRIPNWMEFGEVGISRVKKEIARWNMDNKPRRSGG